MAKTAAGALPPDRGRDPKRSWAGKDPSNPYASMAVLPNNWHTMSEKSKKNWQEHPGTMRDRDIEMYRRGGNW